MERTRGRTRLALLAGIAGMLIALAGSPASAVTCRDWKRMAPYQKSNAVDQMIHTALSSQSGRQYQVNRGAIERCLYRQAGNIELDFDDTCLDSRASMQALNQIFKDYIWSCVR